MKHLKKNTPRRAQNTARQSPWLLSVVKMQHHLFAVTFNLHRITIFFVPARNIALSFSSTHYAVLTKRETHTDVIRSPHIDKKSREQFSRCERKYVTTTAAVGPYLWLGQLLQQQSSALRLQISTKKRIIFQSRF